MAESQLPEQSPEDAPYRGPVEMSGWVLKFQSKLKYRKTRRYFKLSNSTLSNHRTLTAGATWQHSLSKSNVITDEETFTLTIRLARKLIKFQVATIEQTRRWRDAIRSASRCNINDYYEIEEQLGCGSYGTVHIARDRISGQKRAVKILKRSSSAKEIEFLYREMNILLSVHHRNIVQTYDIFDEKETIYLVMDHVAGGDLAEYMNLHQRLAETQAREIIKQVLEGVSYLHQMNIVHRDIKLENILLVGLNPVHIQITDFGFANFTGSYINKGEKMTSMVGTGTYMAPEIIDSRGHGKPVDLYAIGVVLYRIISGKMPYYGLTLHECYLQAISKTPNFNDPEWMAISRECKHVCESLLLADPSSRPSVSEALAHPWFNLDQRQKGEQAKTRGFRSRLGGNSIKTLRKLSVRLSGRTRSTRSGLFVS